MLIADGRLRCRQARDRHAEGRAGNVGQADAVAELHGGRIAAVLAADAQLDVGAGLTAEIGCHLDQLADADLVEAGEGIVLVDLLVVVSAQELAGVVTGEAEGHLGQVVGAEGEELGLLGDLVRGQRGARDLDHGADLVVHIGTGVLDELVRLGAHDVLDILELLDLADQRDHDLGHDVPVGMVLLDVEGGLDDGAGLHLGDLRIGDGQAAAAVTHHGVELVQAGDDGLDLLNRLAHILGQLLDVLFLGGHELVQRGIQEADGDREAFHGLVEGLEVALLHGLQNRQRLDALLDGVGADHAADGGDAVGIKEHVLGAAQADAFRAQRARLLGVAGGIRVGADAQTAVLVGPLHHAAEFAADGSVHGGDLAVVDAAGGAVDAQPVALDEGLAGEDELLVLLIHGDLGAAGDAAGAHAAGDDRRVRGHAAADGQDALRGLHALDIFGRGLQANQNNLLALFIPFLGVLGGEDDAAAGSSGRSGQRLGQRSRRLERLGVELRVQQGVQGAGLDHQDGLLVVDHAFVHQVAGDLERRSSGALAVAGLEHVELAVLDGELHVLHIAVVVLQRVADAHKLLVDLGHDVLQVRDGVGGAHAGDDVLALRVHQELAEEGLFAGGGVAGEGNAGAGGIAHVAEGHHLDVNGSAPGIGDVVVAAIDVGAGVVPGAEDRLDGAHQLFLGIGGEILADLGLVFGLELVGQLLQVLGGQLDVELDALFFLHLVDEQLEVLLADFHDDVRVHLDEAAVAVVGPAGVAALLGHDLGDFLVQTQVQDGIHHAGHGRARAGADGNEQGVFQIAELLAGDLFHLFDVLHDLRLNLRVDLATVFIILGAGLGGDGEALGHRQAEIGHLRQVRALAAQQVTHGCVALAEEVNILVGHVRQPP